LDSSIADERELEQQRKRRYGCRRQQRIMNIADAIEILETKVPDPRIGLPDEVFYYISKTTPLVNVDLLIKDENNRTLLSWRDDPYCGKGWHIPGGVVRINETFETRIKKVAETEIGVDVEFDATPIAINELIYPEFRARSHFISFLYKCYLPATFVPPNIGLYHGDVGYLAWHDFCPDNLIACQEKCYKEYI
jgi:ADP-ribose pyrophosphatase YjhB (NUDIX family)